ncbi:MAG: thiol oxidoreductase [Myxococcales bacterium]|nr:thiol oxidoreductase [Myxococcales bacterium]
MWRLIFSGGEIAVKKSVICFCVFLLLGSSLILASCGVFFTEEPALESVLDGPIDGLSQAQLQTFKVGDEEFGRVFTPATGLGPIFVEASCAACHTADGKGHPSTNLTRFGVGDPSDAARFDYLLHLGGPQLQHRSVMGYEAEKLPEIHGLARSVRSAPIVTGLGLIEAIPESEILRYADPDDADGDGISGRPNYVKPPAFFEPVIEHTPVEGKIFGRFGRKATAINLLQQVAEAYLNDMGITSDFLMQDLYNPLVGGPSGDNAPDPEVPAATVRAVTFYMQTLRPPSRRDADDPTVKQGEALFAQSGCAKCHVPSMKTGKSPIAALHEKTVFLYSDLLLHDMGPKLADHFPEGSATGNEWRTTPLWGLGVIGNLLGGQPFYMHDGRAKTLEEAIDLHGGEAQKSRDHFFALKDNEKAALLAFLRSL